MLIDTDNLYMINLYENLLEGKLREDHGLRTGKLHWSFFPGKESLRIVCGKLIYSDTREPYCTEDVPMGEIMLSVKRNIFEMTFRVFFENECSDYEPLFKMTFEYKRYRSASVDVDGVARRIAWELEHAVRGSYESE